MLHTSPIILVLSPCCVLPLLPALVVAVEEAVVVVSVLEPEQTILQS